jgi:CheY-like chemotaxis protein
VDQRLTILIAEDDENDISLLEVALRRAGINNPLQFVQDGEEAIDYLCQRNGFSDRSQFPFPTVVILDIKMPRRGGLEVLQWLREHPECSIIPSIVLSASAEPQDVQKAYELGASTYFQKPTSIDELTEMMRSINQYWNKAVKPTLPTRC